MWQHFGLNEISDVAKSLFFNFANIKQENRKQSLFKRPVETEEITPITLR